MDLFKDTKIDFMKYRKFWIIVSLLLVAVGFGSIFVHGKINVGIDFAGGTQITLEFAQHPDVDRLRKVLESNGLSQAVIQRYGDEGANQVMVKTSVSEKGEEGSGGEIVTALDKEFNGTAAGGFDLNQRGTDSLAEKLLDLDPEQLKTADADAAATHYQGIAQAILDARKKAGIFASFDQVASVPTVTPEIANALRGATSIGQFGVLSVENVGPQVGKELRTRGAWAVLLSLVGMLVYIWFRFELRFGIGATMASLHDVLVTLGLFALFGFEFNLTTVAAFLTLVGYSVNDTVVIFDRIRENMRKNKRMALIDIMNWSINETLSRTILTSSTTFLAALTLFIFGGDVIRGFAFVMAVGVVVGTYSSIYIASPFTLLWEQYFPTDRAAAGSAEAAKVRAQPLTSSSGVLKAPGKAGPKAPGKGAKASAS